MSSRAWWRGFGADDAIAWLAAAALLSVWSRFTAAIPVVQPLRAQLTAQANAIALHIFLLAAAPGVIGFGLLILWNRSRQD